MKLMARMAVQPGMIVAEDICSYDNKVIIRKNTVLEKMHLKKLDAYSIVAVPIKDAKDFATTHFEKLRLSDEFQKFERIYRNNLNIYKLYIANYIHKKSVIQPESIMQLHNNVRSSVKNGDQLLDMLYNMLPSEDDMTYAHCFNAGLISNVFGHWLCMSKPDIETLTLCGFLYDIGKIIMPVELIWKPDKLTEFEYNYMKTHTTIGYDLLKDSGLDPHIINASFMHHERCDGSGYPAHLNDGSIDFFAKIVGIVDSYEAMTSARIYRASMNPFQVIDNFEKTGLCKYNELIITPILEKIANNHLGSTVRLSDDTIGEIIIINKKALAFPMIKVGNQVIDLAVHKNVSIINML